MISPKEKTRSPMATAAWLTLLGPPSRWTVHHIAAAAYTSKLRWHAFWFPRSSWHLVFESHLVGILSDSSGPVSPVLVGWQFLRMAPTLHPPGKANLKVRP